MRKIRNDFAHTAEQIGFDNGVISSRCHSLALHGRRADSSARTKFKSSMTGLLMAVEEAVLNSRAVKVAADYDSNRRKEAISEFKGVLEKLGRDDFDDILAEFV